MSNVIQMFQPKPDACSGCGKSLEEVAFTYVTKTETLCQDCGYERVMEGEDSDE